ncbi:MAG: hypothetical protein K6A82_00685 [Prevotella sp.]|nr:hypothetical protein [Prevotella sp.]
MALTLTGGQTAAGDVCPNFIMEWEGGMCAWGFNGCQSGGESPAPDLSGKGIIKGNSLHPYIGCRLLP